MSKRMETRKWETPQLVVIARGTPEERVLSACKNNGQEDAEIWVQAGCIFTMECDQCATVLGS
jgi:hypothetical protein